MNIAPTLISNCEEVCVCVRMGLDFAENTQKLVLCSCLIRFLQPEKTLSSCVGRSSAFKLRLDILACSVFHAP